jgi:mannosyltransferase
VSLALAALILVGAALRFPTLGQQRYWPDEAVTAGLLRLDVPEMLTAMSTTESTPPLYYILAWGWALVFGTGEVELRSLSALLGTLTIPVVFAIGATLASRRAGLAGAALAAVSPALIWYSQEARSYALFTLLGALSLLFAARATREGNGRDLAWWAVTALLALLTHYFAAFLVAGEAVWLLAAGERRRIAAPAVAVVAAGGAALLPLALHQSRQGNLDFIDDTSLATRLSDLAELFMAGPTVDPLQPAVAVVAGAALGGLILAWVAGLERRRTMVLLVGVALAGVAAPALLALVGLDYVLGRNLLPLWIPLAVAVAIGLSTERRRRLEAGLAAALVAASTWLALTVPFDRTAQREAITAGLVGRGLDAREQRIATPVAYAVAEAGEAARVTATCPSGYAANSGGAMLRSGGETSTADDRRVAHGWTGSTRSLSDGTVISVYAVCVRPLN